MRLPPNAGVALMLALPVGVLGADILKTSGYSTCLADAEIKVDDVNISYDRSVNKVIFDVAGSSTKVQNVTATLTVTAYGKQVYEKFFDPCEDATKVDQLCPGKPSQEESLMTLYNSIWIIC